MIHDLGQECFQEAHVPVYEGLQSDSKKPLYTGCKNSLTVLSMVLSLVNVKARYGWSDKSFTSLLEVVHNLLPEDNTLPKTYYKAKKILCLMGMEYQKIHACPNDCILYRHEFQEMSKCPICGTSRYKVKDEEESSSDDNSNKGPQRRVCGIVQSFQGLSIFFLMRMTQKTSHGMQMEGFLMEWSIIRLIAHSGTRLMVCIWISGKSQEILDLD